MLIGFDIRRAESFGVGTYIQNLIRTFAQRGAGHEYVLVGDKNAQAALSGLPANFRFVSTEKGYNSVDNHLRFQFVLRQISPDLFHIPHRVVPYFMPCPYVVTVHDLDRIMFGASGARLRAELRLRVLRHGLARAERIITVSQATRRDLIRLIRLAPERIDIVPNAIDPRFLLRDRDEDRCLTLERYQVDYPFLLYVGNIQPQKNLPRLVEAFAIVAAELEQHPQYRDLRLIIVGDYLTKHPDLRRSVIRSRVQQKVRFLGFVPMDTLRIFYRSAAAFAFPSLYEGFGLPPLEAMAQGTPVVTSNVSSLPEVVGDAAVLVNPENPFDIARGLRQVLLDDELRSRLCERGLRQVARFSWDRAADRILEIYRAVIAARDRSTQRPPHERPAA